MGMFDSFYDKQGAEWQTKAFACLLDRWDIGATIPGPPIDYQAEVIGGTLGGNVAGSWKYATIRAGVLVSAGDERDESLPLCLYSSGWELATKEQSPWT